jgi:hypothetical protein
MSTTPCSVGEIEAHGVFFHEDHTGQAIAHQGYLRLRSGRFRELFSKKGRNLTIALWHCFLFVIRCEHYRSTLIPSRYRMCCMYAVEYGDIHLTLLLWTTVVFVDNKGRHLLGW